MSNKPPKRKSADRGIRVRIRVLGIMGDAFGPGKAQLLEEIVKTGSLREAAIRLQMSYMKGVAPYQGNERKLPETLLKKSRGGRNRGGTELTELGQKALATYQQMTIRANRAAQKDWKVLSSLLKSSL